jgi:hypothetical protein
MRRNARRLTGILAAGAALLAMVGAPMRLAAEPNRGQDRAPEVWLAGVDPTAQQARHVTEPADYMDLFKPDAPWKNAASGLAVFKVGTRFALHADDAELRTMIDDLKRRHIAFAVELGVLESSGPGSCGYGVEGYGNANTVESVARRVQKLGGRIDYVAMDEPVWFGHIVDKLVKTTGRGCQYSVPEVADRAAAKIAVLRQYFPDIKIGDIEPVTARAPGGPQYIEDVLTFEDLLRKKTGAAPAFVHADMAWALGGWQPLLVRLATRLRASGLRFGVICDGDPTAGTNEAWVEQALQRCRQVAADPRTRPDDLIAQTWEPLPTRMLPETHPGAMTYEALQLEGPGRRDRAQGESE